MPKAIEQLKSGITVGYARLGAHGPGTGSPRQQVHDGDTVILQLVGNLGIRFLGVDAPEISFSLPGSDAFVSIGNEKWESFLANPFSAGWPLFSPPLTGKLQAYLEQRTGPGVAANHHRHAQAAEKKLEDHVLNDMAQSGQTKDDFTFFLAFARDKTDQYGRLLGYINRNQPQATDALPRPRSYNERLLADGMVLPYFIWPNISPFLTIKDPTSTDNLRPETLRQQINQDKALGWARRQVRNARSQQIGVFAPADPLILESFELRFLAGRRPPNRWLIDLNSDDNRLLPPQKYFTVPHPEDRLWIPPEYVPLFAEAGWKRGR